MTEELTVTLDPDDVDDIRTVTTDERGRAYLGSDLANSEVQFAILDTTPTDDAEDD